MQGNAPMHPGQGPGLSLHDLGETGGSQFVTLLDSEMPAHSHLVACKGTPPPANAGIPDPAATMARSNGGSAYTAPAALQAMNFQTISPAGGSLPHNNMQPYLTLNFNIALQGVFPPRT